MLAIERKNSILDRILREGKVVVTDLSTLLGVTEETIRRDLNKLEREGLVSRTHGGAVAPRGGVEDLPYKTRHLINVEAKRAIAAKAAGLVQDGDAVMLDSSSTAHEALRAVGARRDLTLITNSVRILSDASLPDHTVMSVGGELRRRSMTFVGPLASQAIARFNADIALLSCKALSLSEGIMENNIADAEVKRAFIENARRVCLLVDSGKFDRTALIDICGFDLIDVVVTDKRPSDAWLDLFERCGVQLIC